ncbi:hypothetical protein D3C77_634330 [compost metagenome]
MARDHFVGIAHRREVVGLVPFDQQGQVGEQLGLLLFTERYAQLGSALDQFFGMASGHGGHQAVCSRLWPAPHFFRWISSREMAAGVTPGIREACPRVSGRACVSLWVISLDRPEIAA